MSFKVPILFLVFNRPATTDKVLGKIRSIRPSKLFIAADGPRKGNEFDEANVQAVRKLIEEGVDWPCETRTLFREQNVGCGVAVSSAIDWFFQNVEEGIILEDDTLPDLTFFEFCDELLAKYRHNSRVMCIGGTNLIPDFKTPYSYIFTRHAGIWGWATWKRAWQHYDFSMELWKLEEFKAKVKKYFGTGKQYRSIEKDFQKTHLKLIDTWDYQWYFARIINDGIGILPKTNLISNIGFDVNATHTMDKNSRFSNMAVSPMSFPLKHPDKVEALAAYDRKILSYLEDANRSSVIHRLARLIKKIS